MAEKSPASPLPWVSDWPRNVVDSDGRNVFSVVRREDLPYIVTAVNSHQALVDALAKVVRGYDGPTVDIGTSVAAAIPAARAALKLAGVTHGA